MSTKGIEEKIQKNTETEARRTRCVDMQVGIATVKSGYGSFIQISLGSSSVMKVIRCHTPKSAHLAATATERPEK